jgi:hypothetical protein
MRTWLADTSRDPATVAHTAAVSPEGGQAEQWRLTEGDATLTMTVRAPALAAAVPAGTASTWFWVEDRRRAQDARGLVRRLLNTVPARDSAAVLASAPLIVAADGVDPLIDVLCDPDRQLPAMVAAAHPAMALAEWGASIGQVTRDAAGLASIYLLAPAATEAFNQALGETHGVWGGALRTYMPVVDPASTEDGRRHRVMLAARMTADPYRVGAVLADFARRHVLDAPLPLALRGVTRMLLTQAREPDARGLDGEREPGFVTPGNPGADPDSAARQARLVSKLRSERDAALALAEEQEARANSLYAERENLLAQLAEREQRVLELESRARTFRQRLGEAGILTDSLPVEAPAPPPGEFAELIDWVERHLPRVAYTGAVDAPLELDMSPESPTWARSAWEALRALQAYADVKAARGFSGDFRAWCKNPPSPDQYVIPPNRVKMDESETVRAMPRWRQERVLPVPPEVDPDGRLFMGAHVTIGASATGRVNPRLYFHDGVLKTGKIYVGYIGRHLTNTLS